MNEKFYNSKLFVYSIPFITFFIYFFPYFDLGNCLIRIHDNLDSYMVYYHVLAISKTVLQLHPLAHVDNIMNGIPRLSLPSGFNVINLFYYLFGTDWGYVINLFTVHLIGFFGMQTLLKKQFGFTREGDNRLMRMLISLSFALLPVFAVWGISLMGQPFLLNSFMNISKGINRKKDWIIIVLFPFYSLLVFAGFFIIASLGVWFVIDFIKKKKLNKVFLLALIVFTVLHLIVDYQLFYGFFLSKEYESQRSDDFNPNLNLKGVLGVALRYLFNGFYHSSNYVGILLLGYSAVIFIWLLITKKDSVRTIVLFASIALLISIIISINDWYGMRGFFTWFPIFVKFSLKRFHFLLPLLVYIVFAVAVYKSMRNVIMKTASYIVVLVLVVFCFQLRGNFERNGFNMDLFKKSYQSDYTSTYNQYFQKNTFKTIIKYINKPQSEYRVVSLGINPTVLQYNGFYTLDGYQNNYPKSYSILFAEINEDELVKISGHKWDYMDRWCYIKSADNEKKLPEINSFSIDIYKLVDLNCQYLFSKRKINDLSSGLILEKVFPSEDGSYPIYLYRFIRWDWVDWEEK